MILDTRKLEDRGEALSQQVAKHIKSLGGKVQQRTSIGRKQFARPIGQHRAGAYWDFVLDLAPSQIPSLKDKYKLNEAVLRLTVFRYREPIRKSSDKS